MRTYVRFRVLCVRACKDGATDKYTSHARRVCEQISRHACAISIIESGCREPVCKATEKPADRLRRRSPRLPARRAHDSSATPITSAECEIEEDGAARPDCEWSANGCYVSFLSRITRLFDKNLNV